MSSQTAMTMMSGLEFVLYAAVGFVFWKKGLRRRFPAMGLYLALHVVSSPLLSLMYLGQTGQLGSDPMLARTCTQMYFFVFWASYVASAILIYFICLEIFRSVLTATPGLQKLGIVIFRWAALVSAILSFSSISLLHHSVQIVADIAVPLMRSVSLLELCLLGFLCLSMNALRLSVRDVGFGLSLGLGIMAADDFVTILLIPRLSSLATPLQFAYEGAILLALGAWVTYCALPEPVRKPVVLPVNSTIYRWNEIASALGHTGTQVVVQQPANSFFLTDVENVVEKVLNRNLKRRESES